LTGIALSNPDFEGAVPPDQQANYTVTFAAGGTFSARADCNTVNGTYTTTPAGDLRVIPGPSTTVACPDGSYADLYILALTSSRSYIVVDELLTITLEDGGTLVYRPAP
jgi:para-nitrobenzyl esterase